MYSKSHLLAGWSYCTFFSQPSMWKLCYCRNQHNTNTYMHPVCWACYTATTTKKMGDILIPFSSHQQIHLYPLVLSGLYLPSLTSFPLQLHPHFTWMESLADVLLHKLEFHARSVDGIRPCMWWRKHLREVILCSFYLICLCLYTAVITMSSEHLIIIGNNLRRLQHKISI